MGNPVHFPWFTHLVAKLLAGDKDTLALLTHNPFPERAPLYVRAELYEYELRIRAVNAGGRDVM